MRNCVAHKATCAPSASRSCSRSRTTRWSAWRATRGDAEAGCADGHRGAADVLRERGEVCDVGGRNDSGHGHRPADDGVRCGFLSLDNGPNVDLLQIGRYDHRRRERADPHETQISPARRRRRADDVTRAPRHAMSSTLRTQELTKSYGGRTVVRGVSIEVASGEIVGLLGPNGAGKTTTFYMTVGLTAPGRRARHPRTARTSPTTRCTCARGRASATCRRSRRSSAA